MRTAPCIALMRCPASETYWQYCCPSVTDEYVHRATPTTLWSHGCTHVRKHCEHWLSVHVRLRSSISALQSCSLQKALAFACLARKKADEQ